jgi:hypothetical protein
MTKIAIGVITTLLVLAWVVPDAAPSPLAARWERGTEGGLAVRAVCVNEQVNIFTSRGTLETRNFSDGAITGNSNVGFVPSGQPQVQDGLLLTGGTDGSLYALDAGSGSLAWKRIVSQQGISDLSAIGGAVYLAGGGELIGFSLKDGNKTVGLPLPYLVLSAPLVTGKTVYFGTTAGTLYAADLITGIITDSLSTLGEFYHQKLTAFRGELLLAPTGDERRVFALNPAKGLTSGPLFEHGFSHESYPDADALMKISFQRPQVRDMMLKQFLAKSFGDGPAPSVENTFLPLGPVHTSSWVVRGDRAAITVKEPDCLARARYPVMIVDMVSHKLLADYQRLLEDTPFMFCADPVFEDGRVIAVLGRSTLVSLSVPSGELEWESTLSGSVVPPLLACGKSLVAVMDDGRVTALSVQGSEDMPLTYGLDQNVPNPFNPATTIRYRLPRQSRVTLKIYNISGQEIVTLVDSKSAPGTYRARWNGMNARNQVVPSGTYFALIRAGNFKKVISMTLLK